MTRSSYATALDPRKQKVLSSPLSFFFKLVFPVLCFSLCASLLVAGILAGGVGAEYYIAGLCWIGATSTINWWNNVPLKRVAVYGDSLRISNYHRQLEIPLALVQAAIKTGRPTLWWRWPPLRVVITLSDKTVFGSRIMFIPGYYVEDVLRDLNSARHGVSPAMSVRS